MSKSLRQTAATLDVLRALSADTGPVWGLQIVRDSGRPAGSVYPILVRLEEAGWAMSHWETESAHPGPRRRYYALTEVGHRQAAAMLAVESGSRAPRAVATTRLA